MLKARKLLVALTICSNSLFFVYCRKVIATQNKKKFIVKRRSDVCYGFF